MINQRIYTFLTLCNLMNYRATAETLQMTQPAVTQHIQYLEREYSCKLFEYDGKKLTLTLSGELFRSYSLSVRTLESRLRHELSSPEKKILSIGTTRTIGDYVIYDKMIELSKREQYELSLTIENTNTLLNRLEKGVIDMALIEGFFDKNKYDSRVFKQERFVGVCSKEHPFANKTVSLEDLFSETMICREIGSGTRAIFEQLLVENNYSMESFQHTICLNSFRLIANLVRNNCGISFLYESITKTEKDLSIFTLNHAEIYREFNFVFIKDTFSEELMSLFL